MTDMYLGMGDSFDSYLSKKSNNIKEKQFFKWKDS